MQSWIAVFLTELLTIVIYAVAAYTFRPRSYREYATLLDAEEREIRSWVASVYL